MFLSKLISPFLSAIGISTEDSQRPLGAQLFDKAVEGGSYLFSSDDNTATLSDLELSPPDHTTFEDQLLEQTIAKVSALLVNETEGPIIEEIDEDGKTTLLPSATIPRSIPFAINDGLTQRRQPTPPQNTAITFTSSQESSLVVHNTSRWQNIRSFLGECCEVAKGVIEMNMGTGFIKCGYSAFKTSPIVAATEGPLKEAVIDPTTAAAKAVAGATLVTIQVEIAAWGRDFEEAVKFVNAIDDTIANGTLKAGDALVGGTMDAGSAIVKAGGIAATSTVNAGVKVLKVGNTIISPLASRVSISLPSGNNAGKIGMAIALLTQVTLANANSTETCMASPEDLSMPVESGLFSAKIAGTLFAGAATMVYKSPTLRNMAKTGVLKLWHMASPTVNSCAKKVVTVFTSHNSTSIADITKGATTQPKTATPPPPIIHPQQAIATTEKGTPTPKQPSHSSKNKAATKAASSDQQTPAPTKQQTQPPEDMSNLGMINHVRKNVGAKDVVGILFGSEDPDKALDEQDLVDRLGGSKAPLPRILEAALHMTPQLISKELREDGAKASPSLWDRAFSAIKSFTAGQVASKFNDAAHLLEAKKQLLQALTNIHNTLSHISAGQLLTVASHGMASFASRYEKALNALETTDQYQHADKTQRSILLLKKLQELNGNKPLPGLPDATPLTGTTSETELSRELEAAMNKYLENLSAKIEGLLLSDEVRDHWIYPIAKKFAREQLPEAIKLALGEKTIKSFSDTHQRTLALLSAFEPDISRYTLSSSNATKEHVRGVIGEMLSPTTEEKSKKAETDLKGISQEKLSTKEENKRRKMAKKALTLRIAERFYKLISGKKFSRPDKRHKNMIKRWAYQTKETLTLLANTIHYSITYATSAPKNTSYNSWITTHTIRPRDCYDMAKYILSPLYNENTLTWNMLVLEVLDSVKNLLVKTHEGRKEKAPQANTTHQGFTGCGSALLSSGSKLIQALNRKNPLVHFARWSLDRLPKQKKDIEESIEKNLKAQLSPDALSFLKVPLEKSAATINKITIVLRLANTARERGYSHPDLEQLLTEYLDTHIRIAQSKEPLRSSDDIIEEILRLEDIALLTRVTAKQDTEA
jgi:hypothetical protein